MPARGPLSDRERGPLKHRGCHMLNRTLTCTVDDVPCEVSVSAELVQNTLHDRYVFDLPGDERGVLLVPAGTEFREGLEQVIRALRAVSAGGDSPGATRCYILAADGLAPAWAFGVFPDPVRPGGSELCLYAWPDPCGGRPRPAARAFYFTGRRDEELARLASMAATGRGITQSLCLQPDGAALSRWVAAHVGEPDTMFLDTGNPIAGTGDEGYWAGVEYGR